jgi:hypothetical protein
MRRCLQSLRPRDHDHLHDIVHVEGRALSAAAQHLPRALHYLYTSSI